MSTERDEHDLSQWGAHGVAAPSDGLRAGVLDAARDEWAAVPAVQPITWPNSWRAWVILSMCSRLKLQANPQQFCVNK